MQYFILMIDYGKSRGFEAVVHPELTRREIVEQVRDVLASNDRSLVHVKFIDGNFIEDVTADICAEAGFPDAPLSPSDRQASAWDHARSLRNEVVG